MSLTIRFAGLATRRDVVRHIVVFATTICALLALTVPATRVDAQSPDEPAIAAAADLNAALPEVLALFTKHTGKRVRVTFGSSGAFTQQIQNGAPFQLFLSADERYVSTLAASGKTDGRGVLYAIGRIGLFLPKGSRIQTDSTLKGFAEAVRRGDVKKFAIANPEHAPYGRAAQDALQQLNVWTTLLPTLVLGENAAQAAQFATSGSTDGGIIPLALALTPQVQRAGSFVLIPADRHQPLRQRMVVIKGAGSTARALYDFLQTPDARAVLSRYGFVLPTS